MTESAGLLADNGLEGGATTPPSPPDRATGTGNDAQTDEKIDREQLLAINSDLIRTLHRRISGHRFRANKHDGTRLAVARALVQAVVAHNQVLRDLEVEELERRIAALEAAKK
ncbi:hypothetical protein [Methanoculleus sp.]|jgi:hypothetical protein|uniref:hypothetical protein n=1 Tax=Methanoculleus sp. TaxID=90427 RepID=UPI001BD403A3|nr:hypothetical protein [Methanoculleus sp.]